MLRTRHSRWAFFALLATSSVVSAAVNVKQTYTNRTTAAASGFRWWWNPDTTVSGVSSSAFTSSAVTHYPNGLPFSPITQSGLRVDYTQGNVNVGASATMYVTFAGTSMGNLRSEWLNAQGLPAGNANLPCSLGGSYPVSIGSVLIWNLRIDNPSDQVVMLIDNLRFAVTTLQLSQQALADFTGPWQVQATNIEVSPGGVYEFNVATSDPNQLVVVDADLFDQTMPNDVSNVRFQIVPEPATSSCLIGLAVWILGRRRD